MPQIKALAVSLAVSAALGVMLSGPVHALEAGDWTLRAGATGVFTEGIDSDPIATGATGPIPGTEAGTDDAFALGLTVGYAITAH